jgi:two-component system, LytTR family, sensor kinase
MTDISRPYKSFSGLWFALGVVLIVSFIFPLLFAYIDQNSNWPALLREFWFTPLRLLTLATFIYLVIQVGNRLSGNFQNHWLRHVLQLLIILPVMYALLYGFVKYIDLPLSCGDCAMNTNTWEYRRYIGLYFFGTVFLYTFLSGLNFYNQALQKSAEAEKLQKEFAQVRLQALKSQVNPHFLFNSLSVLSELVQQDPVLSEQFIIHLSKAYRYILDQKDASLVTLQEELDFLDAYFFLMQIRFGNKIKLSKQINTNAAVWELPPLTLQLLVENAVKHNKMSASDPLLIQVAAQDGVLQVTNRILKREQSESSTGIGLQNIQKRVAYVTDLPVTIASQNQQFQVTIPLVPVQSNTSV